MVDRALDILIEALPVHAIIFLIMGLVYVSIGWSLVGLAIGYPVGAILGSLLIASADG